MGAATVRDQLVALWKQGHEAQNAGRPNLATRCWKRALMIAREAHRSERTIESRENLIESLARMAALCRELGRFDVEVRYLKKAIVHIEALPSGSARKLAVAHSDLARARGAAGDAAGAVETSRVAVAQFRTLHERSRNRATSGPDLAIALERLGDALVAAGNAAGAISILERALATREETLAATPSAPAARHGVMGVLRELSRLVAQVHRPQDAVRYVTACEKLLREEIANDPGMTSPWARFELASLLFEAGHGYLSSGEEKRWGRLKEAYELLDGLRRTQPLAPRYEVLHQTLASDLREHNYAGRSSAETRAVATPTVEALMASVYENPEDNALRAVLADALSEVGDPRGEFIALQCQPTSAASEQRQRRLLRVHADEWLGPLNAWVTLPPSGAEDLFSRGFPARVSVDDRHGPSIFERTAGWATIEELTTRRFEFHRNLKSLRVLHGIEDAGTVRIPRLEQVLMRPACFEGELPFTVVRELGCLLEDSQEVCALFASVRRRPWFRKIESLVTFDPRLAAAAELHRSAPATGKVAFRRKLRDRFFPLSWCPPFSFELTKEGELTLTIEPHSTFDEGAVRAAVSGLSPVKLVILRAAGVSGRKADHLERLLSAAIVCPGKPGLPGRRRR